MKKDQIEKILSPIVEAIIVSLFFTPPISNFTNIPFNFISYNIYRQISGTYQSNSILWPYKLIFSIFLLFIFVLISLIIKNKRYSETKIFKLVLTLFVLINPIKCISTIIQLLPHGVQFASSLLAIQIPIAYWFIQFIKGKSIKVPLILYIITSVIAHIGIWYFVKPELIYTGWQGVALVIQAMIFGYFLIMLPILFFLKIISKKYTKIQTFISEAINCSIINTITIAIIIPFYIVGI